MIRRDYGALFLVLALIRPEVAFAPHADDVVGEWLDREDFPNAGGKWHAFFSNRLYVDMPDVVDCNQRLVARAGRWEFKAGRIYVTVTDAITIRGGTIESEGISVPSTIVGAKPIRTRMKQPKQFLFRFQSATSMRRSDGLQIWKYSESFASERRERYKPWFPGTALPPSVDVDASCEPGK